MLPGVTNDRLRARLPAAGVSEAGVDAALRAASAERGGMVVVVCGGVSGARRTPVCPREQEGAATWRQEETRERETSDGRRENVNNNLFLSTQSLSLHRFLYTLPSSANFSSATIRSSRAMSWSRLCGGE